MEKALDRINDLLISEGYVQGEPSGNPWVEDDKRASTTWMCAVCDRVGMIYHPYTKGRKYRAILECPNCGRVIEI